MTLLAGKGHMCCVEPVSWLSMKVTALAGHHPIMPGALPSFSAQTPQLAINGDVEDALGGEVERRGRARATHTVHPQFTSSCRCALWS
ncbi:hypothetical protein PR202_ga02853 [Eleusine coracana subsp. coracana]|uniref:Uncharacterized protein n=1 Tax=Eleusine coracana subsp. coracana TaxID=191504 RepID=A0AAV5BMS2_ELECO|nr:hypothetical protein PR202_ga02853 [Eleusine coracana subsp. coracana]